LAQLEAPKIVRCRRVGRTAKENCERPDVADIVGLRLIDDWRTVMSSIMRRRSGLTGGLMGVSLIAMLLS
jgi:hypothetical protein